MYMILQRADLKIWARCVQIFLLFKNILKTSLPFSCSNLIKCYWNFATAFRKWQRISFAEFVANFCEKSLVFLEPNQLFITHSFFSVHCLTAMHVFAAEKGNLAGKPQRGVPQRCLYRQLPSERGALQNLPRCCGREPSVKIKWPRQD